MTTDRELLEMAAKAARIKALRDPYGFLRNCTGGDPAQNIFAAPIWNPLTDDGDALRLAVKLGICIEPYPLYSDVKHSVITKQRRRSDQLREANPTECVEVYGTDPNAATRRAIVRAAAEIGRSM